MFLILLNSRIKKTSDVKMRFITVKFKPSIIYAISFESNSKKQNEHEDTFIS